MAEEQVKDLAQIGASPASKDLLRALKAGGHISELQDGYRLAIALAIADGLEPRPDRGQDRETMFAAALLDPDQHLRLVIQEMYPNAETWPMRAAEDLAEQGLERLRTFMDGDRPWFTDVINHVEAAGAAERVP